MGDSQAMAAKLSGGGGDRYSLGQNSEINVTPFVDILLVLLIIFMVAVPMAVTSIKIDLPPASPPPPGVKPKEPVFISIQKSGALYVAEKQTSLDNLQYDLDARFTSTGQAGPKDDQRVMIRADADVLYADFMGVLNQLQTAGWYKVGLINEDIH
jgi:biopolymer transport protein ExbD